MNSYIMAFDYEEDWFEEEDDYEFADPTYKEFVSQYTIQEGFSTTAAEGEFGKLLKKAARLTRTTSEIFEDRILKFCAKFNIPHDIKVHAINIIPIIPDIYFKSATGIVLGLMFIPVIRSGNQLEKKKLFELIEEIKEKGGGVTEYDGFRYAKAIQKWQKKT